MKTVNRSVAIVRPREPYIQWALSVDDGAQKDEASLRSQVSVYLVPPDPILDAHSLGPDVMSPRLPNRVAGGL